MRFLRSALLMAIPLLLTGCTLFPPEEEYTTPVLEDPPPSRTVTQSVEIGSISDKIKSLGRVSPVLESSLYFARAGTIKSMVSVLQQRVRKGQVLAQLEMGDREHALRLAELTLQEAKLELDQAEQLAEIEGRPASLSLQQLQIAYKRADEDYTYIKQQIEDGTIRAPFDGIISRILKQGGNTTKEYETVYRIQDPSTLQVSIELTNEDDFNRITLGMPVRVEATRGVWVDAFITQIPSYSDRNATGPERDRSVKIEFNNPGVIKPNLNDLYSVEIIVREEKDAMLIPKSCLHEFMGRSYVRILEGETQREVDVSVGIRTDPLKVQIVDGLKANMQVVCR